MSNQFQNQQAQQNFTTTLISCSPTEADPTTDFNPPNIQQNPTNLTTIPPIFFSIHHPDQIHEATKTSIKSTIKQTHGIFGKISTTISATTVNIWVQWYHVDRVMFVSVPCYQQIQPFIYNH